VDLDLVDGRISVHLGLLQVLGLFLVLASGGLYDVLAELLVHERVLRGQQGHAVALSALAQHHVDHTGDGEHDHQEAE